MKVWTLWYGGPNYTVPCIPDDVEHFPTLQEAKRRFDERAGSNGHVRCQFLYVNREEEYVYCPTVEDSEMWIYFYNPSDVMDPYPDRVISFGPRRGIQVERV